MDVYYYISADKERDSLDCGIKLSEGHDKTIHLNGKDRKCFSAFLNPRDNNLKYLDNSYVCIKMDIANKYCYIAEGYFGKMSGYNAQMEDLYLKSIMPCVDYVFGTYRSPECLVTTTVIGDQISKLNRKKDSPLLYESSEELYINNIMQIYKEQYYEFGNDVLYSFYNTLAMNGKIDKFEDTKQDIAVFVCKEKNKTVVFKIPDWEKYDGEKK